MLIFKFGKPGCGKTCDCRREAIKRSKDYDYIYMNFKCAGFSFFDTDLLSDFIPPPKSLLIIDEAGIVYNNRKFKTLPQKVIEFYKKHRHTQCDIIYYSQSFDDVDCTLLRLNDSLVYMSRLPFFTLFRPIEKTVMCREDGELIWGYRFKKFWHTKIMFRPLYYDRNTPLDPPKRPFFPLYEKDKFTPTKSIKIKRFISRHGKKFFFCALVLLLFFL